MDWTSLYGDSEAAKLLTQYPDKNLLGAVKLLRPEERPKVPVRLTEDPAETYAGYGVTRSRVNPPIAFVAPDRQTIFINKKDKNYKNPQTLASKIAHEAYHLGNDGSDGHNNEVGAVGREVEVLGRYGNRYRDFIGTMKSLYGIK
jgi:hypothetical protein